MQYASPARVFWRNKLAVAGAMVLCCLTLVSVLGYWVTPDGTPAAGRQFLELALRPPGTRVHMLLVNKTNAPTPVGLLEQWLGGQPDTLKWMPLAHDTLSFTADTVQYIAYNGLRAFTTLPLGYDAARFKRERVRAFTYYLGSDAFGRDVLSRLILGGRVSLGVGALAVAVSLLLGVGLGTLAGFARGWIDSLIVWFMSVMWALPSLLLAIAISFAVDKGFSQLFIAVGLSIWVEVARLVRGEVLSLRERTYVEAARVLGLPAWRIVVNHILPALRGPIVIMAAANFATAVLLEAGLSFLGLGVRPPTPSWGAMVNEGYPYLVLQNGRWLALAPGVCLMLLILSLNLVGLGLRDAFDPKRVAATK